MTVWIDWGGAGVEVGDPGQREKPERGLGRGNYLAGGLAGWGEMEGNRLEETGAEGGRIIESAREGG